MTALIASRLTLSYPAEGRPGGLSVSLPCVYHSTCLCLMVSYVSLISLLHGLPCCHAPGDLAWPCLALACVPCSAARWAAVVRGCCGLPCPAPPGLPCPAPWLPCSWWPVVWVCDVPGLYACPCSWWSAFDASRRASMNCPI